MTLLSPFSVELTISRGAKRASSARPRAPRARRAARAATRSVPIRRTRYYFAVSMSSPPRTLSCRPCRPSRLSRSAVYASVGTASPTLRVASAIWRWRMSSTPCTCTRRSRSKASKWTAARSRSATASYIRCRAAVVGSRTAIINTVWKTWDSWPSTARTFTLRRPRRRPITCSIILSTIRAR